jgi:hypothetical protein
MDVQWIFFMNSVNHSSRRRLVWSFQGGKGIWKRESYIKMAEEKEGRFLASGKKLVRVFSS